MTYFSICHHENSKEVRVHGFIDSYCDRDINGRSLCHGYVFRLFGGPISSMSKKKYGVSLLTIEDECIVTTHGSKEEIWMQ